jgi:hypothetical protein
MMDDELHIFIVLDLIVVGLVFVAIVEVDFIKFTMDIVEELYIF